MGTVHTELTAMSEEGAPLFKQQAAGGPQCTTSRLGLSTFFHLFLKTAVEGSTSLIPILQILEARTHRRGND